MPAKHFQYALSCADFAPPTAPILLTGGIQERIAIISALGYTGIEVHLRETDPIDTAQVKAAMEKAGIRFSALVTGRLCTQGQVNLCDDRPYIVEAAMQGMREYISLAGRLGTDIVVGWIRGKIPGDADKRLCITRLARNLKALCEEAAEKGVKVFVEVLNRYETNIFTTAEETTGFLDEQEIPNCFIHLDTFHMNIEESDLYGAIEKAGKRLGYFHVADNTRRYPGSGTLDFGRILSILDGIAYEGFISVECLPWPDGRTAAELAIAHLKEKEKALRLK